MRILLVQPRQKPGLGFKSLSVIEPLALEMVAASLTGHEVRILDLFSFADLAPAVASFAPDLCGISCSFTVDVYSTLRVAAGVKAASPRTFVFVGGHHASLKPDDFLSPDVNAIALGEGESIAPDLAACLERGGDLSAVKGLALNQGEEQVVTGTRPLVSDLDALPLPARHLTRDHWPRYYLGLEKPIALVQTSRGCPYRCNFCSVWNFYQKRVRTKSPERVVEEVASIDGRQVMFADDNFFLDIARAREIARLIEKRRLKKRFYIQARSDAIVQHPELIEEWSQVGLGGVFIGFEKITEEELEGVNKRNSVENNETAIKVLRANRVGITPSFIVDPSYGHEEFARLRRYIQRWRLGTPSFTVLTPLPGTELFRELRSKLTTSDYELFDLLHPVLPTRLSLNEFYQELARLYQAAIPFSQIGLWGALETLGRMLQGDLSLAHVNRMRIAVQMLTNPACYLADHLQPKEQRA